jgi:6-phosphofructokinase 1
MGKPNAFYAQSGGVTSVINASACGLIETARARKDEIGKVYAGRNGIIGALNEELIDTSKESKKDIAGLRSTPGGAFGSCRFKLKSPAEDAHEYNRLIDVFCAHNIGYFFYNGGGDSQDTANKVAQVSRQRKYPIQCIGIPKTVDNDLPFTDCCPGFGSVAKYVAISTREAALDVASMCESSTKVFVLEVMGRHAGWIAAASALAQENEGDAPHIILLPEVPFQKQAFLRKVKATVNAKGYCVIVVSEGARYANGAFLGETGAAKDAFGHAQLGGVAPTIAAMIKHKYGYKYHWAVSDYLQRAARHIASATDVDQAYTLGKAAVEFALAGKNAVMPTIVRTSDSPYRWKIGEAKLSKVANVEKFMPKAFISRDGFGITPKARKYLLPLIAGEDHPKYKNGLPQYVTLKNQLVAKKLPEKW